jgi:hypothetical protein
MRLTLGASMVAVLRTFLTLAWYLVAVGAPAVAALNVLFVSTTWPLSVLRVSGSVSSELKVPVRVDRGLPPLEEITGLVAVETLPTGVALGCTALWLAGVLLWLPVIWQLRRLTEAILRKGPFLPENIRRLGRLGATIIVVSFLGSTVAMLTSGLAATAVPAGSGSFSAELWSMPVTGVFLGLVMVALAEVFRVGLDLRDDNELTI